MPIQRKSHAVAAVEDALLRCVRARGAVARSDLAKELGLVPSTIGVYVERLVRDGFLVEAVASGRSMGRPPILLQLNPRQGRFIGVDFDARSVMGMAIDFSQRPIHQIKQTLAPKPSWPTVKAAIESIINELIGGDADSVLGIGLGLSGIIDPDRGILVRCNMDTSCRNVEIVEPWQDHWGIPVSVENNLRSLALAEYWFGRGRGVRRLACLGVRTGIALGTVIDGKLYRGATNAAGEIGLWNCPEVSISNSVSGPPTITPTGQSVESTASVNALLTAAAERLNAGEASLLGPAGTVPTLEGFLAAITQHDELALDLLRKVAVHHAWIIHQLALVLDPDLIILASPLTELPAYLEMLYATCRDIDGESLSSRIVPSELGTYGGAMGAAAIAVHNWSPRAAEVPETGGNGSGNGKAERDQLGPN